MAGGCGPDESSQWTVSLETTRQYPALRVASIVRYTSRPTYPELVVDESTGHPDRHREDNYEEALHIVAFCLIDLSKGADIRKKKYSQTKLQDGCFAATNLALKMINIKIYY